LLAHVALVYGLYALLGLRRAKLVRAGGIAKSDYRENRGETSDEDEADGEACEFQSRHPGQQVSCKTCIRPVAEGDEARDVFAVVGDA
ncbi:hypothetical protein ACC754_40125, partial [Rhizobium johnstonii]